MHSRNVFLMLKLECRLGDHMALGFELVMITQRTAHLRLSLKLQETVLK